ncbi:MAG: ammonium transporter [Streptosporangiales bacterium]|nr:ammonium transporter [Streptosporangiales bacterium]
MIQGDTAWVLTSAAFVMLMTPGVAFFYGGMVRSKSVLNMLMMCFTTLGIVSILWVLYGYSIAFTTDVGGGLLGGLSSLGLAGTIGQVSGTIPELGFSAFQLMFAILTPALIAGAVADRMKFGAWVAFSAIWVTLVYFPVAHWVFFFDDGNGGWIGDRLGVLDFAGGTAVHINAGAAALALVLVLGKRKGWPRENMRPHNLPFVLLGAGLLWFGWFGFNAGSAVAANDTAAIAFMNTQVATGAAALAWILVEKLRDGNSTTLGLASGAVAGLVAITPACASVNPIGAIAIGLIAGAICAYAVGLKYKLGYDDSLDVVGVHLVGGLVGSLLIGLFATSTVVEDVDGLLYGGGLAQLGKQAIGAFAVLAYSSVVTWVIAKVLDKTMGLRVAEEDEAQGVDLAVHAESGYEFGSVPGGGFGALSRSAGNESQDAGKAGKAGKADKADKADKKVEAEA